MKLPGPFTNDQGCVNVIVETPSGSRNKFAYDEATELFKLRKILPGGTDFPLEMGFIPGTKGGDGDPLDMLILMEKPTYPGCLVECRVLGVMEAEQLEKGAKKPVRNDRLIAVPDKSHDYANIRSLKDIEKDMIEDWVRLFKYYNKVEKKKFTLLGIKGPKKAMQLVRQHIIV